MLRNAGGKFLKGSNFCRRTCLQLYSTSGGNAKTSEGAVQVRWICGRRIDYGQDLRAQLMAGVKAAMKSKDTVASITLRSVLSEVYAADKAAGAPVSSSAIASVLRKAVTRRHDAALKFNEASRSDLAEKEAKEAELLTRYLPTLLSEADIDRALREALENLPEGANAQKAKGLLFKEFYSKVDKSLVDPKLVNDRAAALLAKTR